MVLINGLSDIYQHLSIKFCWSNSHLGSLALPNGQCDIYSIYNIQYTNGMVYSIH